MPNRRHASEREGRRSYNQNNFAAEDARRRFQDPDYDRYFPEQNYYHPRRDESSLSYRGSQSPSQSQYGMESQFGRGMQQDYGSQFNNPQHGYGQSYSDSSSFKNENQGSSYGRGATQSWSPGSYEGGSTTENWSPANYERSPSQNWSPSQFERGSSQSWSPTNYESGTSQNERSFFGKGPKGFKRSDERIKEEVSEALYRDSHVDASEIEVTVQNGEVTLSGTVETRRMKRLAEDCVENVSGVSDVRNEIRVQQQTSSKNDRSASSDESAMGERSDRTDKSKNRNISTSSSKLV